MADYKTIIDIGTNSFHLIVAEIESGKIKRIAHNEKVIMRLGAEGESVLKHINEKEIQKSVEVLNKFVKLAEFYNSEIYSVATSAVRESDNGNEFTSAIEKATGIKIKVIDGNQEAAYIYSGVTYALPVKGKKVLCIDIGGGSTEVIIGQDGKSDFVQSYKLGAVRLSKMFFPGFTLAPDSIKRCSRYITDTLRSTNISDFVKGYDVAVGASGTLLAISAIVAAEKYSAVPQDLNGFSFTSEELKAAAEKILYFPTPEERQAIKGIELARADILPAGTLILLELFSILNISSLTISGYALREGFLLDILSNKNIT